MAATKRSGKRVRSAASSNGGNKPSRKRSSAASAAQKPIGADDVRHLAKAPSGYQDVMHKFADALEWAQFRAPVSPAQLRSLVSRATRAAQRAAVAQLKATAADRQRIMQEAQAWKSVRSAWRSVLAAMPDHPELEEPFAFMQDYMAASRSAPVTPRTPATPATPAAPTAA